MCGIFGYNGSKPPNLDKLKILGLWNISRGKDSCGYYYDGELRKGFDKTKQWDDFIKDGLLITKPKSKGALVFMGHTRKSTKGASNEENAHPFLVDGMVQTHNGTLENSFDLCDDNKIDHSKIYVDSLALAHLIKKIGWKVLDQYVGFAANMWYFENEPDTLYVYHGASRTKYADEVSYEERPLFYLETKNGVYFSSIAESLTVIRDAADQEPQILPHNKVFKFTKGKRKEIVYTVQRKDNNLKFLDSPKKKEESFTYVTGGSGVTQGTIFDVKPSRSLIWKERKPAYVDKSTDRVYFYRGRFHRQMETASKGVFEVLLNGKFCISKGGYITTMNSQKGRGLEYYYFVDGVMLLGEKQHKIVTACTDNNEHPLSYMNRIKGNFAKHISRFSRYPVTNLEGEGYNIKDEERFMWYKDEKLYTGGLKPKFSQRTYNINTGKLLKIERPEGDAVFVDIISKPEPPKKETVKPVYTANPDVDPKKVAHIISYFQCNWINIAETLDFPDEVFAAIEEYMLDLLDQKGLDNLDQKEKDEYFEQFIKTAIDNNITFYENMEEEYRENLQYYVEAGIEDVLFDRLEREKEAKGKVVDISSTLVNNTGDLNEDEDVDESGNSFETYCAENEIAKQQFDELMDHIKELRVKADSFQSLENSELAQEIAHSVYCTVDAFKANCYETIKSNKDLLKQLPWLDLPF